MKKNTIIITVLLCITLLGIGTVSYINYQRHVIKEYGSMLVFFELRDKNDSNILTKSGNFTISVNYSQIQKEKKDFHIEFEYQIPEKWKTSENSSLYVYSNFSIQNHYYIEWLDDKELGNVASGVSGYTMPDSIGSVYRIEIWERGKGPYSDRYN